MISANRTIKLQTNDIGNYVVLLSHKMHIHIIQSSLKSWQDIKTTTEPEDQDPKPRRKYGTCQVENAQASHFNRT